MSSAYLTPCFATPRARHSYDLEVATLQAAALSAFASGASYTFEELGTKLNLQPEYLKPVMHSLCCGKYKVIAKSPANNKINPSDTFTANKKFKNNNKRVKIPMASLDSNVNVKKVNGSEGREGIGRVYGMLTPIANTFSIVTFPLPTLLPTTLLVSNAINAPFSFATPPPPATLHSPTPSRSRRIAP